MGETVITPEKSSARDSVMIALDEILRYRKPVDAAKYLLEVCDRGVFARQAYTIARLPSGNWPETRQAVAEWSRSDADKERGIPPLRVALAAIVLADPDHCHPNRLEEGDVAAARAEIEKYYADWLDGYRARARRTAREA